MHDIHNQRKKHPSQLDFGTLAENSLSFPNVFNHPPKKTHRSRGNPRLQLHRLNHLHLQIRQRLVDRREIRSE